jgi:queuine tRNA-ribosyltransferase
MRLVTLHNLTFVARLMDDLRAAIDQGRLSEVATALRDGATPETLGKAPRSTSSPG